MTPGRREPRRYAPPILIRPAEPADTDAVLDLLAHAAVRMATIGIASWPARFERAEVAGGIGRGEVSVAVIDGTVIGTFALTWRDPTFWGEQPPDAGYVHRLAVHGDHARRGLGARLLDHAARLTRERGRARLRLDVPADNVALASYYERLGFAYCGDTEGDRAEADGSIAHWVTRRYERAVDVEGEEPCR